MIHIFTLGARFSSKKKARQIGGLVFVLVPFNPGGWTIILKVLITRERGPFVAGGCKLYVVAEQLSKTLVYFDAYILYT